MSWDRDKATRVLQATPEHHMSVVVGWSEVEAEVSELAALARRLLDSHVHKTLATLRHDGSPRISSTEVAFADAKLAGRAEEVTDPERKAPLSGADTPPGPSHRFHANIDEVVVVRLGDPADIIIEPWHTGRGVARRDRR